MRSGSSSKWENKTILVLEGATRDNKSIIRKVYESIDHEIYKSVIFWETDSALSNVTSY